MDVLADGAWEKIFKVKPEVFTKEEKTGVAGRHADVALGSDAFLPVWGQYRAGLIRAV